jgi:hypothetical protein
MKNWVSITPLFHKNPALEWDIFIGYHFCPVRLCQNQDNHNAPRLLGGLVAKEGVFGDFL